MKTGFWKALAGSCSGTAVFASLRQQHLGRAIWHFFLMLILCSLLMTWGLNARITPDVMRAVEVFAENCGGIQIDESGITPLAAPEKKRSFLLPGVWAVTYLPLVSAMPDPTITDESFTQGAEHGVIWTPRHQGLWRKVSGGYEVSVLTRKQPGLGKTHHFSSAAEVIAGVRQMPENGLDFKLDAPFILTPELVRQETKILLPVGIYLVMFQQTLSEIVIYLLMFAAVFTLMNLNRPNDRVRFKELLKLEIYAGFPAMLIGSAAVALDLPFLEFNIVYVFGMTLYLIWILNKQRAAAEHDAGGGGRTE